MATREISCPRAKSDMTPCVASDGRLAATNGGLCVGCGENAADLLADLVPKYVALSASTPAEVPHPAQPSQQPPPPPAQVQYAAVVDPIRTPEDMLKALKAEMDLADRHVVLNPGNDDVAAIASWTKSALVRLRDRVEAGQQPPPQPSADAAHPPSNPDDLRAMGYMVAVHNDYRLDGELHTFWLLTHPDGHWLKGEGCTDAEALNQIREQIQPPTGAANPLPIEYPIQANIPPKAEWPVTIRIEGESPADAADDPGNARAVADVLAHFDPPTDAGQQPPYAGWTDGEIELPCHTCEQRTIPVHLSGGYIVQQDPCPTCQPQRKEDA